MKIVCDWDDFTVGTALTNLLAIKEHYPNFRLTAFTIPMNISVVKGEMPLDKLKEWAKVVSEYDWIEIAMHGFAHMERECVLKRADAEVLLTSSEKVLTELGLNWVKVFKAPYWQASNEMYEVLRDRGYLVAVDRNQPEPNIEGLKTYAFNWSFEEKHLPSGEWIKGHGHFYGSPNDILLTMPNFFKQVPPSAEFHTITEYAEATRIS